MPELIDSWMALIVTMSFLPSARAISGVVTMAQAAPSDTQQQSNRPSGSAIIGAPRIASIEIALRKCAFGLWTQFWWRFHDNCAQSTELPRVGTERVSQGQTRGSTLR